MKICFATNNKNKLEEVQNMLPPHFELVSLEGVGCTEELREDQDTLEGNSLQKAQYVFDTFEYSCFADDTGLEVPSINGEPGVKSARYAGDQRDNEANIQLLLDKLEGKEDRSAQFRTVITLVTPDETKQFEGVVKGKIISQKVGEKGFGYDPVFVPEGYDVTFAQMSMDEKNKISHRARAFNKLSDYLSSSKF
ncbi:non-canonical purine NTP diphosphatase [Fulvivirga maritima]|uniref:non-canonical purine NTP diphosphatase n=1 Tax=Fulvivirga maritima TaxID=2904247 RepID=UPI001F1DF380|nr:non-canonical purine NTP diphosphatase [Fulvivirga maritima]UII28718.1 non-canonical purine NTP diphosphatase [Fulvivirga maritima]